MLRPVSRYRTSSGSERDINDSNFALNESFDERNRKRAMSLRIFDGDIRLSCGNGRSTFIEEKEIDFDESTGGGNKLTVDSNERETVDGMSISSELDQELEVSDLSGDSASFASHEGISGIEEELSSDFPVDEGHKEISTELSNIEIGRPLGNQITIENDNTLANGELKSSTSVTDGASKISDGASGGDDATPEISTGTGKATLLDADDKETGRTLENANDFRVREVKNEKRNERTVSFPEELVENLDNDEKGVEEVDAQNVEAKELDTEKEDEEKPASSERLSQENKDGLNNNSDLKKEVSSTKSNGQLYRTDSDRPVNKRFGRTMRNFWPSIDDEELVKDDALTFYETELSRSRERLEGEPPSQNIIKCLVSLTTPRDLLSVSSCEQPAFVEFDMNYDGFGYLHLASLTPSTTQSR